MGRFLSLMLAMCALFFEGFAQRQVQGIARPDLNTGKTNFRSGELRSDTRFSFEDIQFWVGSGSNRAALVIEWHDGTQPDAMVWGYKWDGEASGHDMIVAIAKADPRLVLLTQYTGPMGYTIDGIGYSESTMNIQYNLQEAKDYPRNAFDFDLPIENTLLGQTSVPEHPAEDVAEAIREGLQTGVIYHPLNAEVYGYPSYDYDSWTCDNATHWEAGWYEGYWSYFVREGQASTFSYSGLGATSRKLEDGSWDAWSWNGDMSTMEGTAPGDHFIAATPIDDPTPDPDVPVSYVTLSQSKLSLSVGSYKRLEYTVFPTNATNQTVSWSSSDPRVATVENGMVHAIAAGMARITVKTQDGGYTAECVITVNGNLEGEASFDPQKGILSFQKVANATSYEIRQYRLVSSEKVLEKTYVLDENGDMFSEFPNLRSSSQDIDFQLSGLETGVEYLIEIQVMNGLDIVGSFEVDNVSIPTGIENVTFNRPLALFKDGGWVFRNLHGYADTVADSSGHIIARYHVNSTAEYHYLELSQGIYIVFGDNKDKKVSFKIIIK